MVASAFYASCLVALSRAALAPITGVAFSGGGSRAYVAALGQLQAMRELGLLDGVDHLAGVSGGAWAVAVDSMAKNSSAQLTEPDALNLSMLNALDGASPHLAVCRNSLLRSAAQSLFCQGCSAYEAWRAAVHSTFLAPFGLSERDGYPIGKDKHRPTTHFGVAVLGQSTAAPFALSERGFACLDCSPDGMRIVGGKATGETRPSLPLSDVLAMSSFFPGAPLQTDFSREVAEAAEPLWDRAVGKVTSHLRRAVGRNVRVSLPSEAAERMQKDDGSQLLLGDGGSVGNLPMPLLLSLGARRCVCMINVGERLPDRSVWDPHESSLPPPGIPFCEDLAALFGLQPRSLNPSKDLQNSNCFEASGFAPLVAELQASADKGEGAFAVTQLTTIANAWWGVPAGERVDVAWSYIARAPAWESLLPDDVSTTLMPPPAATSGRAVGGGDGDGIATTPNGVEVASKSDSLLGDASRASIARYLQALLADAVSRRGKSLDAFPQYPLTRLQLSAAEANALYQLSGWSLLQHEAELATLLEQVDRKEDNG